MMLPYKSELDFLLRDSIENGFRGFSIHYQPLVQNDCGRLYGAEALARWNCGKYGDICPNEFIPILEENGKIIDLEKWIFKRAAAQCKKWCRFQSDFRMSVNLSCRDLEKTDMKWFIQSTLGKLELAFESIILELTESWPLDWEREKGEFVHGLEKAGIQFAMDDFGSGYSSLMSLQRFPFQLVKIDGSFVKNMVGNEERTAFVSSLTQFCHNVGRQVCLEGVETWEEWKIVRQFGIEVMQGYYFGRPVPAEEFERLYL